MSKSDSQKDTDGDGVMDDVDACAETPEGELVDEEGYAVSQLGIEGINFMRGELSGGSTDIIEIQVLNGATSYAGLHPSPIPQHCLGSGGPRAILCDLAPTVNSPDFSYRENSNTGATFYEGDPGTNGIGVLVIDLGSEQIINPMSFL